MTFDGSRSPALTRRWKYAAPPWRFFETLVEETRGWLEPREGERTPEVAVVLPNERVAFAPWVDEDVDEIEVIVESHGQGTQLTVLVHAAHELTDERRKEVRHRVGQLFGDALRHWTDGW